MTYATATDLVERYAADEIAQRADRGERRLVPGKLLALAAAGGNLDDYTAEEQAAAAAALQVVQRALNDAEATITGYVSSRYAVPVVPVPDVLKRVACELARFYLHDDMATDRIKQSYDAAIKMLQDVQSGKLQIGAEVATGAVPPASALPELVTGAKNFSRERAQGFI